MIIFGCKHRILQEIPYQNSGMWMQVSSLPTNSSLENTPRYQFSLKSETIDKMATIANQRLISIQNIKIYLEIKFVPNRRIFVFWRPFWIQNGRHSKPKWSPYGAACLTSCKYPFPLKSFHFWIFNDLFNFYIGIGGHFEMVAILKWWPFWKFQDLNAPLEMGIHLPVKFSKDRIISLWEFDRTKSKRE